MPNRLADSTSPYLRQHADNPVGWWEWGEDAFAEAVRRNVPVLLSVGYAACHWCHVMARESFADAEVAAALNEGFVAIKVDREERPDIDAIYMSATTAMTGHGGWPMTCLLTPEGEPFWAGTYLPRADFLSLLSATGSAWAQREEQVRSGGAHAAQVLREAQGRAVHGQLRSGPLSAEDLEAAVLALYRDYDAAGGGFGGAPKFPASMVLQFLARHAARTGDERALRMLVGNLDAMARGGINDQLAGGFARYAVDGRWVVPHFEKMLYDNAQLLRCYTAAAAVPGVEDARRVRFAQVAQQTAEFLLTDLRTASGGFASALDADTAGVEGATYVWTPQQLIDVLGETDGRRAAGFLSVTDAGTFEHGASTLQLLDGEGGEDEQWWAATRTRLLAARRQRPQPARDDKVVTAWNGLAITALAEAGWRFDRPEWIASAGEAAAMLLDTHLIDGVLHRSSLDGVVSRARAVAEDHGNLIEGLITLHLATADQRWLSAAQDLLVDARAAYRVDPSRDAAGAVAGADADADEVRFADTPVGGEPLLWRPAARTDNAEPCGQSALAAAMLAVGGASGSAQLLALGARAAAEIGPVARTDPRFAGAALSVAEAALQGPMQLAISDGPGQHELVAAVRAAAPPGVVALAAVGLPGSVTPPPLLLDRPGVRGAAALYVCRGTTCDLPITSAASALRALSARHVQ